MKNRQIKFKAKSPNGEWVFFTLLEATDGESPLHDANTVCEFTGLKDKNGNKIYEGDILQPVDSEVSFAVVKFENGEYVREWQNTDNGGASSNPMSKGVYLFKVVGNIYENPELISK